MAQGRIKRRLKRPLPRNIQAMKDILDAPFPKTRSLSVRNVRRSARQGLERRILTVTDEGNDSRATAAILGLPVAHIDAYKAHNRID